MIDGSFLANINDYHPPLLSSTTTNNKTTIVQNILRNSYQSTKENADDTNDSNNRKRHNDIIILDWKNDPLLMNKNLGDALKLVSPDGIWNLVEMGYNYAKKMDKRGDFDSLLPHE